MELFITKSCFTGLEQKLSRPPLSHKRVKVGLQPPKEKSLFS